MPADGILGSTCDACWFVWLVLLCLAHGLAVVTPHGLAAEETLGKQRWRRAAHGDRTVIDEPRDMKGNGPPLVHRGSPVWRPARCQRSRESFARNTRLPTVPTKNNTGQTTIAKMKNTGS